MKNIYHKITKLLLAGILYIIAIGASHAQTLSEEVMGTALSLRDTALKSNLAYELDESLTTEVGARRVGTQGDKKSVAWAVAKMKALGFDRVWTEEVTHHNWERGTIEISVTQPYPHKMTAIALGGSVGTLAEGIEAEVVEFENYAALKQAAPNSLKGKIAFVSYRMKQTVNEIHDYGPAVLGRSLGAAEAAKKGAVALIIRSPGTDNNRLGHTGMMRYKDGVEKIPAAALSNPDADILVNQINRGKVVKIRLKQSSYRLENEIVKTANVIGEITGWQTPEDFVLMGAHLDSWDVGTGAIDDGMGVGITLAAAKYILELPQRPRRSVRVILFGAEEVGGIGAVQYIARHKDEYNHHIIGGEWDFGLGRIYKIMPGGIGPMALNTIREIAVALAPMGISLSPGNDHRGQSDMGLLGDAGMPVVNLRPRSARYFDFHHTENDTLDKINPEIMRFNTAVYTMFFYLIAESNIDFRK